MAYTDHFVPADEFIAHLDGVMGEVDDPLINRRYLGFVTLSAVTVFELAIKDILCEFARKKHKVLGVYVESKLERMNGRIKLPDLRKSLIQPFGDKYVAKFDVKLEERELEILRTGAGSIQASYSNLVGWRHIFVHQGIPPTTANYADIKSSYELSKHVLHTLSLAMTR